MRYTDLFAIAKLCFNFRFNFATEFNLLNG
jgi:hypothetical protein